MGLDARYRRVGEALADPIAAIDIAFRWLIAWIPIRQLPRLPRWGIMCALMYGACFFRMDHWDFLPVP